MPLSIKYKSIEIYLHTIDLRKKKDSLSFYLLNREDLIKIREILIYGDVFDVIPTYFKNYLKTR